MNRAIVLGVLVVVLVALVGYGVSQSVMWAESRFGSVWTAAAILCLIGVGIYMLSQYMTQRGVKHTLDAVADFQASSAEIHRANAAAEREYAKGVSAVQLAHAKISVIDYQHQLRQQQQQRMLVDSQQTAQPAVAWPVEQTIDASNGPSFYE